MFSILSCLQTLILDSKFQYFPFKVVVYTKSLKATSLTRNKESRPQMTVVPIVLISETGCLLT